MSFRIGLLIVAVVALMVPGLFGQILVVATPEPMSITRTIGGNIFEMGAWGIDVCNNSNAERVLDAPRIYEAIQDVSWIAPNRAKLILQSKQRRRPSSVIILSFGWAAAACSIATNADVLKVKEKAIGTGCSALAPLLPAAAAQIKRATPEYDLESLLLEPVVLAAGRCESRLAFASKMEWKDLYVRKSLIKELQP